MGREREQGVGGKRGGIDARGGYSALNDNPIRLTAGFKIQFGGLNHPYYTIDTAWPDRRNSANSKSCRSHRALTSKNTMTSMSSRLLSDHEVLILENKIDQIIHQIELPFSGPDVAFRSICLIFEDINRWLIADAANKLKEHDFGAVVSELLVRVDSMKYAFRESLRIASQQASWKEYKNAEVSGRILVDLVELSLQYYNVSKIFYAYHKKESDLLIDDNNVVIVREDDIEIQFRALEAAVHISVPRKNMFDFFIYSFLDHGSKLRDGTEVLRTDDFKSIVSRARPRQGRVRYNLITRFARVLFNTFKSETQLIVDEWIFPWGTMADTANFFSALCAIAWYHIVSIHQGATRGKIEGVGYEQICYVNTRKNLVDDICRISDLNIERVKKMADAFTYGCRTKTPDPVLQPIINIDGGNIALPGAMLLSSNWPRNVLSLHSRISPATFDAQSHVFEKRMISHILEALGSNYDIVSNKQFNTNEGKEEIDIVIRQRNGNFALLGELRWMLQPGDQTEIYNRVYSIRKKVSQIDRKYERIIRTHRADKIVYLPIVIIDGYGGIRSPVPSKIPIVNVNVLLKLLEEDRDVGRIHAFLCTSMWIPRPNRDYEASREVEKLCGTPFSRTGIRPLGNKYLSKSLPTYLKEFKDLNVGDLKAVKLPS
jgi:hypothetical protein